MSENNGHKAGYANAKARRERFVAEYIISQNATKAAQKAGYSEHSAYSQGQRLLKNAEIRAKIEQATEEHLSRLSIDAEYVLQGIRETIERCRQAEPVLDRKGQPVYCETPDGEDAVAYTFNALGALKGYELLGKHLKLFTEKTELSGPNGGPIQNEHFFSTNQEAGEWLFNYWVNKGLSEIEAATKLLEDPEFNPSDLPEAARKAVEAGVDPAALPAYEQ